MAKRSHGSLSASARKERRQLNIMTLPAVIWYGLFCYLPLFGIAFAFKDFTPVPGRSLFENLFINSPWVGLRNFSYLFRNPLSRSVILNTLFYNSIFIVAGIVVSVSLAILLSEVHQKKFRALVQMTLVLPYFISWVVIAYCVYAFLSTDLGLINHILTALGADPVQWYQSPESWRGILIVLEIWKTTGYTMIIYLCSITNIDRTLYEAAALDGATFLQRVRFITLPQLRPTIATLFILSIGSIMSSDFGLFYQVPMDSGALQEVTQTLDVYVYKSLMYEANFSYSSAAAFLQSSVGCILLVISNIITRRIDKDSALI
ncbi:MAG: sugar ABC transporter permease [Ruminiclostridium sp.]|nr:sugar ABC transporter permease [Ruminiclostridium sp.]